MLIRSGDRVRLPAGVLLRGGELLDPVRGDPIPVNRAGRAVLARADGRTVAEIGAGLAADLRIDPGAALADTLAFAAELNRMLLLDVEPSRGRVLRWVSAGARAARFGLRPVSLRRRRPLATSSPLAAAAGVARGLAGPSALVSVAGTLSLLAATAAAGQLALLAGLLGLSLGAALVLHEAGHAILLAGVPACLAVTGLRAEIFHRALPPGRRQAVAAAGPAAGAAAGALLLAAAWLLASTEAALGAAPLAGQALGLTVLAGDGRAACGLS